MSDPYRDPPAATAKPRRFRVDADNYTTNRYDVDRAAYDEAGPWDKTVRYTRARTKMLRRGSDPAALLVDREDGAAVLRDTKRPATWEAL